MKRLTIKLLVLISGFLFLTGADLWAQEPDTGAIRRLRPGEPVERVLKATEVHYYEVELEAGEFLRAVVDQRGIDVIVTITGPDGRKIKDIDSPNGTQGPEPVELEAKLSGAYRIEVRSLEENAEPGKYEAKVEEILTPEDYHALLETQRKEAEETLNWIRKSAINLKTVQAGSGFDDLQPLKKLVGNARIVCLGEATHGTREFFQLKHRMLEFLVSEMGFTIFGIEATMPEGFDVNEYVLTGKGDPAKALAGLYFWTWDTEEVLDMIRWMRQYNAVPGHAKKVKFYGFDMQSAPRAARVTREYLHKVEPEQDVRSDSMLSVLADPVLVENYAPLPVGRKHEFIEVIDSTRERLKERKQLYIKSSSLREWELVCQHTNVLAQYLEAFITPGESGAVRDSSMAQNIRWISNFEAPDSKMVVWAHNGHVAAFSGGGGGVDGMGVHLRRMFGSEMVVFGFAFNEGRFQAIDADSGGLHPFTVGGAPGGSFDSTLAAAGLTIAAIDLRSLPKEGPVARYFGRPLQTRSIGAVYSDRSASNYFALQEIPRFYDAILFVEATTSARPLERGKRLASRTLPGPSNLDFEKLTPAGQPVDWTIPPGLSSFDVQVLSSNRNPHSGKYSGMIRRDPGPHYGETSASLSQQVDAKRFRGRKVSVSAAVRMEGTGSNARAHLWLRIVTNGKGPMRQGFHMSTDDYTIRSNQWQEYHVSGDVGEDADLITYGISSVGDGTVWVDDVIVEAATAH